MMTIRQMRILTAVVRHGSFRACAERMGLSQVVVSTHIRALEKWLGTPLFERRAGMAAELTEKGRHAFTRISAILADIDDLSQELVGERTRRVIKFTTYGFILLKAQDRLDRFRADRPHIDLRVDIEPPENPALAHRVQCGEVDLACFFAIDEAEVPGSTFLRAEEIAIFVGNEHPLADVEGVTGAMLKDAPSIMLPRRSPQRSLTERALGRIGAAPDKVLMETDAFGLLLHEVSRNHAWVCLFADSVDENIRGLRRVRLAQPLPPAQVRTLSRPSARHDPNILALQACLCGGLVGE